VKIVIATVIGGIVGMVCGRISTPRTAEPKPATTHTAAEELRRLHDQLRAAPDGDVTAVRASVDALRPVLGQLTAARIDRAVRHQAFGADDLAARLRRELVAGQADPSTLAGLVAALLSAVSELVIGLLDGQRVPLPPLPGQPLPVPGGPGEDDPAGEPTQPGGLPLPPPGTPGRAEPPADAATPHPVRNAPVAPERPALPLT
jgi:hypothetical protein